MVKSRSTVTRVRVVQLPHAAGLPLPAHQTSLSAGLDLIAAIDDDEPVKIRPGEWASVKTGLRLELPPGTEGQVRPRSGLAARHGLTVLNSPGTIDADYRGEVSVLLINLGKVPFLVTRGERIAQLVVAAHARVQLIPVQHISDTARGGGGFGSTGRQASGAKLPNPHKKRKPIRRRIAGVQRRTRKTRPIR